MHSSIKRALGLACLSATLAFSQTSTSSSSTFTPPTPAQQATNLVTRLTTLLDLTSSQQTEATTIFTTQFTTLATIQSSMKTAQSTFQTDVQNNDLTGINTVAAQIGSLTTQRVVAEGTADAAFYAILTSTQQTKYSTLKLGGLGPGFGPGGPGGPPPGGPRP